MVAFFCDNQPATLQYSVPVHSEAGNPGRSEFYWSTDALQQRSRSRKLVLVSQ